jgi:hypothetical protein
LHENHRLTWAMMNLADDIEKRLRPAFEPRSGWYPDHVQRIALLLRGSHFGRDQDF